MSPQQVFEANQLIEAQIQASGVKEFVNPDFKAEEDAILRSSRVVEPSRLLGRAALLQLDKPHSVNRECARWLYIVSYRDIRSPREVADAAVTLFAERPPIVFLRDDSIAMDPEALLEDLRSLGAA